MAERQKSHTPDGTVQITQKKGYQLGIENVSLKGLKFAQQQKGRT